jgi:hypothetical protein
MEYLDFVVQLDVGRQPGTYVARVIHSPAGEGEETFQVPLDFSELARLAEGVAREVNRSREIRPRHAENAEAGLLKAGDLLFREIFSESIRSRLADSLGQLRNREGWGLRLKIQMGLADPEVARLHALPWEYLYDAESRAFLALGRNLSLVRYVHASVPGDRPPLPPPLQILAVVSEPAGVPSLDLARECEGLRRAWQESTAAEVSILRGATLDRIREQLLTRRFHVLHFMGHGGFDPASGEGTLLLEDESGRPAPVTGSCLADQLRDCTSLRLVFLNACHTARASVPGPFAGVSTALLQAGVPAVVAMQFPITDTAALAFGETVYRRLAAGDSVDAAVAEGRLAIRRRQPKSPEWGTPVLFLRSAKGQLIRAASPKRAAGWARKLQTIAGAAAMLAVGIFGFQRLRHESVLNSEPAKEDRQALMTATPVTNMPEQESKPTRPTELSETLKIPARVENPRKEPDRTESPLPPADEKRTPRSLSEGETVYLAEVGATVSVRFLSLGEGFATVRVSPDGGNVVEQALMGPDSIEISGTKGLGYVEVLGIDWEHRSVTVQGR